MKVDFKKINNKALLPAIISELAGGWDVTVTEIEKIGDDLVICKLGFALALPKGYKLTLVPRSSLTKTHWVIQNSPGLGDEDYRGEYQLRFRCIPSGIKLKSHGGYELVYEEFPFKTGERVGQVYIEEVIPIEFNIIDELPESIRGDGGFGSTNK